ncbi:lysozyme [Parvularcula flava]|nr:lysozyme [Aquisalinus luteolus]NHK26937.1 lysozyme [Aquisalinus luteolus]
MRASQTGIDLIKHFEGIRLDAYKDVAGIWTIGYGHIGPISIDGRRYDSVAAAVAANGGQPVRISQGYAEELLRDELQRFEEGVSGGLKRDINQNQFDAFVSLSYNIGVSAFRGSSALKFFNQGKITEAADAITWWNKATVNGQKQVVQGLVNRRAAEKALFLQPMDSNELGDTDEDSSRVTPEENSPRRKNIGSSRTMEGAVVAGAGGAASAGAAWMNRDKDEEGSEDGEPDSGDDGDTTGDTGTDTGTDTDSGTTTDAPGEEDSSTDEPADGEPADDTGTDDTDTDDATEDSTDDTSSDTSTDGSTGATDDVASDDTAGDDTGTGTEVGTPPVTDPEITREDYTLAFQVAIGVIIVIAVLYIIYARIDDWLNHKR